MVSLIVTCSTCLTTLLGSFFYVCVRDRWWLVCVGMKSVHFVTKLIYFIRFMYLNRWLRRTCCTNIYPYSTILPDSSNNNESFPCTSHFHYIKHFLYKYMLVHMPTSAHILYIFTDTYRHLSLVGVFITWFSAKYLIAFNVPGHHFVWKTFLKYLFAGFSGKTME